MFFGLLAVFPAITALVSSYGLFADASTIGANLQTLALMLPEGSFQIVQDQIARVLAKGNASLGATFLFGLALALWSANAGVKAIIDALNVVNEEREKRSFVRLNLISLAFTTGGIAALLLMVRRWSPSRWRSIISASRRTASSSSAWRDGRCCLPILLVALVLYRFGPSRLRRGGNGRRWHAGRGAALDRRFLRAVLVSLEFRRTTTRPTGRLAPPSA